MIKAIEYGFLTIMLARFVRQGKQALPPYLALGATTGIAFGGMVAIASWYLASPADAALIGTLINEFLFPFGCAMVIYAIQFIGRHVKAVESVGEKART